MACFARGKGVPGANMYISTAAGTATATAISIGRAIARATERAAAGNNSNAATANRIKMGMWRHHGEKSVVAVVDELELYSP